jgi:hypothetical protein
MKQVSHQRTQMGLRQKINLRQYPVFETTQVFQAAIPPQTDILTIEPCLINKTQKYDLEGIRDGQLPPNTTNIPPAISRTGYELLSTKYSINVKDLSILTSIEVGRATSQLFLGNAVLLAPLMSHKQESFFTYVPARYGYVDCLSAATEVALARVRQIISPDCDKWETEVVSLYSKALKSLQAALDSPIAWLEPEVLCATEILALYEVCPLSSLNSTVLNA